MLYGINFLLFYFQPVVEFIFTSGNTVLVLASGVLAQSEACVLSKHEVLGSKPRYSTLRYGVVGNISACHADARGSIPRFGVVYFLFCLAKRQVVRTFRHG